MTRPRRLIGLLTYPSIFASVIEKYVPLRKGHVTTRQNIQMHHIPLLETEKAIRELGESGLSSREGCGNTVRNVTGDPWAGVAAVLPHPGERMLDVKVVWMGGKEKGERLLVPLRKHLRP